MSSKGILNITSIGKKVIIAIAGLFLVIFLLVHLGINLLMLLGDNGELFTKAAHFMANNVAIKVFEVFLFGAFLIHIIMGITITIQNWISRGSKRYKVTNKSHTSFFSKYMFHTGVVIFVFLIIHFMNFYFVKAGIVSPPEGLGREDFYSMAILLFSNKIYSIIYIVALVVLGLHLNHAFHSAFQTLGWNHSKYTPVIEAIATIYAVVVSVGFAIIPVYFLFFFKA